MRACRPVFTTATSPHRLSAYLDLQMREWRSCLRGCYELRGGEGGRSEIGGRGSDGLRNYNRGGLPRLSISGIAGVEGNSQLARCLL